MFKYSLVICYIIQAILFLLLLCYAQNLHYGPLPAAKMILNNPDACQCSRNFSHDLKIVSYALFGNASDPYILKRYYKQLENRTREVQNYYPDWIVWIYYNSTNCNLQTQNYFCQLQCRYNNVRFCDINDVKCSTSKNLNPKLWRFLPLTDKSVELFMSRDIDSKITEREVAAVNQWLNSSNTFHVMRDHPLHSVFIPAGMWGAKLKSCGNICHMFSSILRRFGALQGKEVDQALLAIFLWPIIQYDAMVHDAYHCESKAFTLFGLLPTHPFPTQRKYGEFVGDYAETGINTTEIDSSRKPPQQKCPELCRPSYGKHWNFC